MTLPHELNFLLKLADAVVITDEYHIVQAINEVYTEVTGLISDEIVGLNAGQNRTSFTPQSMYVEMKAYLARNEGWSGIFTNRNKNGQFWTSSITITPYFIEGKKYYVGVFRALEQLKRGEYLNERRVVQLQTALMRVLAISCEIRDPGIETHLKRVQEMTALLLGKHVQMNNLSSHQLNVKAIVSASILHDIGKSAIPEGILYKPDTLAPHERKIVEMHTYMGIDIFNKIYDEIDDELIASEYSYARNIIKYHHERFDGKGYPEQLAGETIPFEARVVSIVDVFDALTTKRPYKDKWEQHVAIDFIVAHKGTQFDPLLVDAFVNLYEEGQLEQFN